MERVYQDIVLPLHTLEDAITLAGSLFEIWPILVYPSRIYDHGAAARQGQFRQPRKQDLAARQENNLEVVVVRAQDLRTRTGDAPSAYVGYKLLGFQPVASEIVGTSVEPVFDHVQVSFVVASCRLHSVASAVSYTHLTLPTTPYV